MTNIEKFITKDNEVSISQCLICAYRLNGLTCAAFPDGIPQIILTNDFDHTEPFDGDNGIRFKMREGAEDIR